MTEKEKMLAGQLYDPVDEELIALREKAHALSKQYNDTLETQEEQRESIMKDLVPDMGEDAYLQGPVQFDYGCFTRIGENTKDIPSGVFAAGVPCRVIREITDADRMEAAE